MPSYRCCCTGAAFAGALPVSREPLGRASRAPSAEGMAALGRD